MNKNILILCFSALGFFAQAHAVRVEDKDVAYERMQEMKQNIFEILGGMIKKARETKQELLPIKNAVEIITDEITPIFNNLSDKNKINFIFSYQENIKHAFEKLSGIMSETAKKWAENILDSIFDNFSSFYREAQAIFVKKILTTNVGKNQPLEILMILATQENPAVTLDDIGNFSKNQVMKLLNTALETLQIPEGIDLTPEEKQLNKKAIQMIMDARPTLEEEYNTL